jgi:hypothetical protein
MPVVTENTLYALFGTDSADSVVVSDVSEVWDFIRIAGYPTNVHVQVHVTETVRKSGQYRTSVKSITRPTCWCGAIAAFVREASNASDAGFVCNDHIYDFHVGMIAIVA